MTRTQLKSLMKADAYPEQVTQVELVQTHVSLIFLTDTHAYKIKKPVNFGFLNFSSIDRRRFYCNEEVRLNRRLCPDIYEGVVELRSSLTGAAFHGNGEVIDYAVKMKRLPRDRMLDTLLQSGEADEHMLRQVAHLIAEFHQTTPTSKSVAEFGHRDKILFNWQENFTQIKPFETTTCPAAQREVIRAFVTKFVDDHTDCFHKRVTDGHIRECDGDIHLENICVVSGKVHIFDCIEFNDRFRYCDTAADIAFLLMDLDYHARPDLAHAVMDEYLAVSGDSDAQVLIDFYKIYRAFVRGKVESFLLDDKGIDPAHQHIAGIRAVKYFRLARGYIERRRLKPTLFITCGLMGSGKSTLADQLAFELGIPCFNSDRIRKQLSGIAAETAVHDPFGEGLYQRETTDATYGELLRLAQEQLHNGTSVIIDASFARHDHRAKFSALAHSEGAADVILHLTCSDAENRRRLQERHSSGTTISDGRQELLSQQAEMFEAPRPEEGILIPLSGSDLSDLIDSIYARYQPC